ncbi:MAG: RNA-binding S4 domain-containing protein [Erysipelotrichaceae bacterium]|nr:RNA-binding S4 domain-containing protein [Erysipelotrichaceae bacterium]MDD3810127.1 RNA-binding S4 domain-containing protein [Erysipelotrichaceae bacterium]
MEKVFIKDEYITLGQFLKFSGIADSGNIAKFIIQDGLVSVNNEVCYMRGKKLRENDIVEFEGQKYLVVHED